ncbi:MAG: hypothetical protein ACI9K5_002364 [Gammaproteobacteria bacterium]|jgi:hypothetical protein
MVGGFSKYGGVSYVEETDSCCQANCSRSAGEAGLMRGSLEGPDRWSNWESSLATDLPNA